MFAFLFVLTVASAHSAEHVDTLQRVAETGEFRNGYVPDAPRLSFRGSDGNTTGNSTDLCRRIASTIRNELNLDSVAISYAPVVSTEKRRSAGRCTVSEAWARRFSGPQGLI
jgi:ABC-type amino acid transport substrate-binding protein